MTAPLLEGRRLTWEPRGRRVLGPLDLSVRAGESLMLLGPNGAGKTTLLRLLTGLLPPTTGEVRLDGEPLARLGRREIARRIAYVPQLRPVRIRLTVEELVLQGRFPHLERFQLAPSERDHRALEDALGIVGLAPLRRRHVDHLSGGERQAVFIAAALAQEAKILVLDEPTTHLDPRHQREIAELLRRLHQRGEHTVIAATHELAFASHLADRLATLKEGRLMTVGPPATVLSHDHLETLFETRFDLLREGPRPLPAVRLEP